VGHESVFFIPLIGEFAILVFLEPGASSGEVNDLRVRVFGFFTDQVVPVLLEFSDLVVLGPIELMQIKT
jgi:hypothetical protein